MKCKTCNMKTIFLSAPYNTKIKDKDFINIIKHNINIAKHAARFLRDQGFNVFCPHTAISGYCDDLTDDNPEHRKKILKMCIQWVEICDFFAQVPGWEYSDGCKAEYAVAEAHGKEIISLTYGQIGV